MDRLGSRLRRARWSRNISITDISRLTGIDKKSIINIEIKDTNCRVDTLWKICKATGISADYVFGLSKIQYVDEIPNNH